MSNILRKQLENRIMIRILLAEKDFQVQAKWQDLISSYQDLQIQYTDQLLASKLTMIIADNELSLIEEKKYEDPIGIATEHHA